VKYRMYVTGTSTLYVKQSWLVWICVRFVSVGKLSYLDDSTGESVEELVAPV
jgi:hypothetical protein